MGEKRKERGRIKGVKGKEEEIKEKTGRRRKKGRESEGKEGGTEKGKAENFCVMTGYCLYPIYLLLFTDFFPWENTNLRLKF